MIESEKLTILKGILEFSDTKEDARLGIYLSFAKKEIINWRYGNTSRPNIAKAVSSRGNTVRVYAPVFITKISPISGTTYQFTYSEANESWKYSNADISLDDYGIGYDALPVDAETISIKYDENYLAETETVQIMACVAGYNLTGAENEQSNSENGISRTFKYSDMVDYIRSHILQFVGVI
jgi:hypothetical protein